MRNRVGVYEQRAGARFERAAAFEVVRQGPDQLAAGLGQGLDHARHELGVGFRVPGQCALG